LGPLRGPPTENEWAYRLIAERAYRAPPGFHGAGCPATAVHRRIKKKDRGDWLGPTTNRERSSAS